MFETAIARPPSAGDPGLRDFAAAIRRLLETRAIGVLLLLALGGAWEASFRLELVKSETWPPLSAVLLEAWHGLMTMELLRPLASTLGRAGAGLAIGTSLGVGLALLSGFVPAVYRVVNPLVEVTRPVPAPAIIPPLILLLGVDDALKVVVVSLAVFYPMYVNTTGGVRDVSEVLLNTARTFRTGSMRLLIKVVFPASLPAIFSGLRIAVGFSLIVSVIAEMVAGSSGIGYFIIESQYSMRAATMYAAIVYLALAGYALNQFIAYVERKSMPWWACVKQKE